MNRTLSGATTPVLSGPGSNGNKGVLHIPQISKTRASSSDCLVSYSGHLLVGSSSSTEIQSVYSIDPAVGAIKLIEVDEINLRKTNKKDIKHKRLKIKENTTLSSTSFRDLRQLNTNKRQHDYQVFLTTLLDFKWVSTDVSFIRDFFRLGIKNCLRLLKIHYVIAIHLIKWLTNFYDFNFKSTATDGIGIHPTKARLSQLGNFKNAIWLFRRMICNKIVF